MDGKYIIAKVYLISLPPPPPSLSLCPPPPTTTVIEGDYAVCMQHLMHFPPVYEVNYLVQRALHLRNPVSTDTSLNEQVHAWANTIFIHVQKQMYKGLVPAYSYM